MSSSHDAREITTCHWHQPGARQHNEFTYFKTNCANIRLNVSSQFIRRLVNGSLFGSPGPQWRRLQFPAVALYFGCMFSRLESLASYLQEQRVGASIATARTKKAKNLWWPCHSRDLMRASDIQENNWHIITWMLDNGSKKLVCVEFKRMQNCIVVHLNWVSEWTAEKRMKAASES